MQPTPGSTRSPHQGSPRLLLAFFFALMTAVSFVLAPAVFRDMRVFSIETNGELISIAFAIATAACLFAESLARRRVR